MQLSPTIETNENCLPEFRPKKFCKLNNQETFLYL